MTKAFEEHTEETQKTSESSMFSQSQNRQNQSNRVLISTMMRISTASQTPNI